MLNLSATTWSIICLLDIVSHSLQLLRRFLFPYNFWINIVERKFSLWWFSLWSLAQWPLILLDCSLYWMLNVTRLFPKNKLVTAVVTFLFDILLILDIFWSGKRNAYREDDGQWIKDMWSFGCKLERVSALLCRWSLWESYIFSPNRLIPHHFSVNAIQVSLLFLYYSNLCRVAYYALEFSWLKIGDST